MAIPTRDYRETNPASGRVEALNPGPPDYNTSALNHSATLPPKMEIILAILTRRITSSDVLIVNIFKLAYIQFLQ